MASIATQNRESELIEDQSDPESVSLGMLESYIELAAREVCKVVSVATCPAQLPIFKPVRLSAATPLLCKSCSFYRHTRCSAQFVIFKPSSHTSPADAYDSSPEVRRRILFPAY